MNPIIGDGYPAQATKTAIVLYAEGFQGISSGTRFSPTQYPANEPAGYFREILGALRGRNLAIAGAVA